MGVSIPNISGLSWAQFRGLTNEIGPRGESADYRQFSVSKSGEYNFKINNSYTDVQIMDVNNKVVATMKSGSDIADAQAKLAPGTYTAIISQQRRGVSMREYDLQITERSNPMILASGGVLKGMAREATGQDAGVQKHGLNVVQGGEFVANMSMPYSRWAIMNKQGKVVASGDTMNPGKQNTDIMKMPSFKLEPGQYDVVAILPRNVVGEIPWNLNFVPKTTSVDVDKAEERPIDKILRERDARLQQWAAEDASKGTTTKTKA